MSRVNVTWIHISNIRAGQFSDVRVDGEKFRTRLFICETLVGSPRMRPVNMGMPAITRVVRNLHNAALLVPRASYVVSHLNRDLHEAHHLETAALSRSWKT